MFLHLNAHWPYSDFTAWLMTFSVIVLEKRHKTVRQFVLVFYAYSMHVECRLFALPLLLDIIDSVLAQYHILPRRHNFSEVQTSVTQLTRHYGP
jgi:hypothetical protein